MDVTISVPTGMEVREFWTRKQVDMIEYPLYSPDLIPADYFLFPKQKSGLEGLRLTQGTFEKELEGVARSVGKDDLTAAFNK